MLDQEAIQKFFKVLTARELFYNRVKQFNELVYNEELVEAIKFIPKLSEENHNITTILNQLKSQPDTNLIELLNGQNGGTLYSSIIESLHQTQKEFLDIKYCAKSIVQLVSTRRLPPTPISEAFYIHQCFHLNPRHYDTLFPQALTQFDKIEIEAHDVMMLHHYK